MIVALSVARWSTFISGGSSHAIGTPLRDTIAENAALYRAWKARRIRFSSGVETRMNQPRHSGMSLLRCFRAIIRHPNARVQTKPFFRGPQCLIVDGTRGGSCIRAPSERGPEGGGGRAHHRRPRAPAHRPCVLLRGLGRGLRPRVCADWNAGWPGRRGSRAPRGPARAGEPAAVPAAGLPEPAVLLLATTHSMTHPPARRAANRAGARVVSMPGV